MLDGGTKKSPNELQDPGLPIETFDRLGKIWRKLDKRQRIFEIGRFWEEKKMIPGPNGEKWGYPREEFLNVASSIIGISRSTVSSILDDYHAQFQTIADEAELTPEPPRRKKQPKTTKKISSKRPIKQKTSKSSTSKQVPIKKATKQPAKPKKVTTKAKAIDPRSPSLEEMREINKRMAAIFGKTGTDY